MVLSFIASLLLKAEVLTVTIVVKTALHVERVRLLSYKQPQTVLKAEL